MREAKVSGKGNYWQAVLARDSQFDGRFVFAVRSTGIYCRPSCPARRPSREQVAFYSIPEAAEQAGFRPCRRCRPREVPDGRPEAKLVRRLCELLSSDVDGPVTLEELSARTSLSPFHLHRTFKRLMGITPHQYAEAVRLNRLKDDLRNGKPLTEAIYDAGYGSSSRLYEQARSRLGMTPATYRHRGAGMSIHFSVVPCHLGRLLVAATERGVCAVRLGESAAALEAGLRAEYSKATILRDPRPVKEWVTRILRHLQGQEPQLDLPLDIQATAFQRRVWRALQTIPYGCTRSYQEIARSIGRPRAVRAAANACAANPVAVVIPCHRVVRKGGDLGGYRWGVKRKRALLRLEASITASALSSDTSTLRAGSGVKGGPTSFAGPIIADP